MNEYDAEYAPAWRFVGTYLHWTEHVEQLASLYVLRILGLPEDSNVPPVSIAFSISSTLYLNIYLFAALKQYITVHVRHGDFSDWCWEAEDIGDCFAPIHVIARRVR